MLYSLIEFRRGLVPDAGQYKRILFTRTREAGSSRARMPVRVTSLTGSKARRLLCGLLILLLGAAASMVRAEETLPWDRAGLLEQLAAGGNILVIRHERTEVPSRHDDYSRPANDCAAQRNLSVAGVAAARETGQTLRALQVKIDRVISSPMCRATETARYMFGPAWQTDARLMHEDPAGIRDAAAAASEMRHLMAELASGIGANNVALVGHGGVIHLATGVALSEGEIAVFRIGQDHRPYRIATFRGSDLDHFARQASGPEN